MGDADALLARNNVRFRAGDLRLGHEIAGVNLIHLLLRNQPDLTFGHVLDAVVRKMRHLMGRLCALQFVASGRQFGVGLVDRGRGASQIVLHFRDLERRQQLSLPDTIADIDVDLAYITGYLGHDIDFLVRLEFRG